MSGCGLRVLPLVVAGLAAALTGCQAYERRPLDLAAYRLELDRRLGEIESIEQFAQRLSEGEEIAPTRIVLEDGIAAAEGEVIALFYNAELRQARARANVALATYETAGLWEDPEFGFDGAELLSPSGPFEYGLTLSMTLPVSGRLEAEKERAGAAHEVELRRIVEREWEIRAAVRKAWAAWTAASASVELMERSLEDLEPIEALTRRLHEAGELSRIESRVFAIELVRQRTELTAARAAESRERSAILKLMGLPVRAEVKLVTGFAQVEDAVGVDDVEAALIERNCALAVQRAAYEEAERALALEIRRQYPDVRIGGGYGNENDGDRLLLGLSVPIPAWNANRGGIATAHAEREAARVAAESSVEELLRELADARAQFAADAEGRRAVEAELVPLAELQFDEARRVADLGEVDVVLLLNSVRQLKDAKIQLVELRRAEIASGLRIVELVGPVSVIEPATDEESGQITQGDEQ